MRSTPTHHCLPSLPCLMRLLGGALLLALLGSSAASLATQTTPVASPVAATSIAVGTLPWWRDVVCYEIFVRSFADSDGAGNGDLAGLIGKLDYLNDGDPATVDDLGVTCLWLMPVMEAESYHGYDVTDYYAVDRDYGTTADFQRLMAEAHARGIRVIVDLVLNHTSVAPAWFQLALADRSSPYRDWYVFAPDDPGYLGPWGAQAWHPEPGDAGYYYGVFWSGMTDLNYRNPAVTAEMEQWSAAPGAGFTTGTPWQPFQDDWQVRTVEAQSADPASLLSAYRRLIHAPNSHPALQHGDYIPLTAGDPNAFAFLRRDGAQQVLVLINLRSEPTARYPGQDALGSGIKASIAVDAGGAVTAHGLVTHSRTRPASCCR